MIRHKKEFNIGLALAISFLIVLAIMFGPFFDGQNAFRASDRLFNSIAKGSAYYIPELTKQVESLGEDHFSVSIWVGSETVAQHAVRILTKSGAEVQQMDGELKVTGQLARILQAAIADADTLYHNRADEISGKYGFSAREALFAWWKSLTEIKKALKHQKQFKLDAAIEPVLSKGLEMSYNFYKIEPLKASTAFNSRAVRPTCGDASAAPGLWRISWRKPNSGRKSRKMPLSPAWTDDRSRSWKTA